MTLISPEDWEEFFEEECDTEMTQREWDRVVGYGNPPKKEQKEEDDGQA